MGVCGLLAVAFDRQSLLALWLFRAALLIAIGPTAIMALTVGTGVQLIAYTILLSPLVPAFAGFQFHSGPASFKKNEVGKSKHTIDSEDQGQPVISVLRSTKSITPFLVAALCSIPIACMVYHCGVRPYGIEERSKKVVEGMTREQVHSLLGEPHNRSVTFDGKDEWIYQYEWSGLGYFLVRFNENGRVEYKWLE